MWFLRNDLFLELFSIVLQDGQYMNKAYAAMFSPFWNEIIKSLREEDYISNRLIITFVFFRFLPFCTTHLNHTFKFFDCREMDLLSIPSNTGSLRLVQWPLFLLCSKVQFFKYFPLFNVERSDVTIFSPMLIILASFVFQILVSIDLAMDCTETQDILWSQICDDEYMAYAVQECYYSVEKILNSMVDNEGRRWYSLSI